MTFDLVRILLALQALDVISTASHWLKNKAKHGTY